MATKGLCDLAIERIDALRQKDFVLADHHDQYCRFSNKDVDIIVARDSRSYEVSLTLRWHDHNFSLSEIIRMKNETAGDAYRDPTALTPAELIPAIQKIADNFNTYGSSLLSGDAVEIGKLLSQQKELALQMQADSEQSAIVFKANQMLNRGEIDECMNFLKSTESDSALVRQIRRLAAYAKSKM